MTTGQIFITPLYTSNVLHPYSTLSCCPVQLGALAQEVIFHSCCAPYTQRCECFGIAGPCMACAGF